MDKNDIFVSGSSINLNSHPLALIEWFLNKSQMSHKKNTKIVFLRKCLESYNC